VEEEEVEEEGGGGHWDMRDDVDGGDVAGNDAHACFALSQSFHNLRGGGDDTGGGGGGGGVTAMGNSDAPP
jgi:hypothetical protein